MGLSGAFGNITMGQIWTAAYNHAGGWRYLNPYFGSGDTTSRQGSALSYAFNSGAASFQVDAYLDSARDTGRTVDEFQFGATINLGDIGKLGIGYKDVETSTKMTTETVYDTQITGGVTASLRGMATLEGMSKVMGDAGLTGMSKVMGDAAVNGSGSGTISMDELLEVLNSGTISQDDGYTIEVSDIGLDSDITVGASVTPGSVTRNAHSRARMTRQVLVQSVGGCGAQLGDLAPESQCAPGDNYTAVRNSDGEDVMIADPTSDNLLDPANLMGSLTLNAASLANVKYFTGATNNRMEVEEVVVSRVTGTTNPTPGLDFDDDDPQCTVTPRAAGVICQQSQDWRDVNTGNQAAAPTQVTADYTIVDADSFDISGGQLVIKKGDEVQTGMDIGDVLNISYAANPDADVTVSVMVTGDAETDGLDVDHTGVTAETDGLDVDHTGVTVDNSGVTVDVDDTTLGAQTTARTKTGSKPVYGYTESHVSLQLGLGAMTGTLGYSEIDSDDPAKQMDKKISFLGLNGSLGDSGLSWTAYSRSVDDHDGSDTNSWGASLTKSLGDGVSTYIDHGNDGADGLTFVGLSVNF